MPWAKPRLTRKYSPPPRLYCCAFGGFRSLCRTLLEEGEEANIRGGLLGCPLEAAASQGHDEVIELLLDFGALVNHTQHSPRIGQHGTALAAAVANGYQSTVKLLLQRGATPRGNVFSLVGNDLMLAAKYGHEGICQQLLEAGCRETHHPKQRDPSALGIAAQNGHKGIVQMLLDSDSKQYLSEGLISSVREAAARSGKSHVLRKVSGYDFRSELELPQAGTVGDQELRRRTLFDPRNTNLSFGSTTEAGQQKKSTSHSREVFSKPDNAPQSHHEGSDLEATQLLLDAGVNMDIRSTESPVLSAVRNGSLKVSQLLHSPDSNSTLFGKDLLGISAASGHSKLFNEVFNYASVHLTTYQDYTDLLRDAIKGGSQDIFNAVLDFCPPDLFSAQASDSASPNQRLLYEAVISGRLAVVHALLQQGIEVKDADDGPSYSRSPLLAAIRNKHESMIKMLVDAGCNVNHEEELPSSWLYRKSFLVIAVEYCSTPIVRILLDHGADVRYVSYNGPNRERLTPLNNAIKRSKLDTTELLLHRGAGLNDIDTSGFTPLHHAAKQRNEKLVELLLNHGASGLAELDNGSLPIHIAASHGRQKNIEVLLNRTGVSINATNKDGYTPLIFASEGGQWLTIEYLLNKGADISIKGAENEVTAFDVAQLCREGKTSRICSKDPEYTNKVLDALFDRLDPAHAP